MSAASKIILRLIFFERPYFKILILLLSLFSALFGLAVPYYQKIFLTDLDYFSLTLCVVFSLIYLIFNQLTLFIGQTESIHSQKKLAEALYRKNLELKPMTLQNKTVGEVVSLYSTDIPSVTVWLEQSLPFGLSVIFPLALTPLFLYYFYDLNLKYSIGLVVVLVVFNSIIAYRQSLFFYKFKKIAAERMGLVNEWIQNIKGLKILNWIEGFENKIIKKRREETTNRIHMLTNGQIMNAISSNMMFWLNLSMLGFFIWYYDKVFTKADIISLLWITTVFLARPLRQLPWFFTFVFDAWNSYKRLVEFFELENISEKIITDTRIDAESILEVKNLNLKINDRRLLTNINLKIKAKEIVALIGPVGAGKSLLIKSLINETPFTADTFYKDKLSYLSQDHFIMSASLRDNVNFDYQSTRGQDQKVKFHLEQAQFDFELDRVKSGLETQIGERGLNLSGGQKQRVSLARQLMNPNQVLLLDDPLSAVDVATEQRMINEFLNLKDAGLSILLTTQRFSVLPYCDRIIFINHGHLEYDGSAKEFLNDGNFRSFLKGLSNDQ